ncbi:hypothetical protein HPB47_025961 [Ixodes persulcatus]|uniref:Uncharacterized protein n=1 Tax=Ixodes persulcatus TaxID=34615 RepID=A0AC60Q254_IXOPE|nr:hypothetical protein HPB47_025961 [Ixodes persulcatus]
MIPRIRYRRLLNVEEKSDSMLEHMVELGREMVEKAERNTKFGEMLIRTRVQEKDFWRSALVGMVDGRGLHTPVDAIMDRQHSSRRLQHHGGARLMAVVSTMAAAQRLAAQGFLSLGNVEVTLEPVGAHVVFVSVYRPTI